MRFIENYLPILFKKHLIRQSTLNLGIVGVILLIGCGRQKAVGPNSSPSPLSTSEIVEIGGIKQYIAYTSNDIEKPILLFLHGGPGKSLIKAAETFNDQLKDHFIVVQWDQRESGKTLELNPTDKELDHELMRQDAHEVVLRLLKKFNRKKLYLVSHSWGSVLGFDIAKNYPELLHAYLPISPIINYAQQTEMTIKMLKKWAIENDNEPALKELETVNIPIQNQDDLFYQQKWLFIHNGVDFATKPGFKQEYYDWMAVWFPVVLKSFEENLFETVTSLKCPVYFIEGRGDGQESHYLAERFYQQLKAEEKKFYWFENSGHTVFNTEPDKLQKVIIEIGNF